MDAEIPTTKALEKKVFAIINEKDFEEVALEIFNYQFFANPVYQAFSAAIGKHPGNVGSITGIPFLPIRFFKNLQVQSGGGVAEKVFKSSGTTGLQQSRHFVRDVKLYETSFTKCFEQFYGATSQFCIVGLLPSYIEQGNSSLVYMIEYLQRKTGHPLSKSYLYDHQQLYTVLQQLETTQQPAILFGVSYALLDFAAQFPMPLSNTTIIETGGMKGRKKEITRLEMYESLKTAFKLNNIHSEYGMTELLSQAYAINGMYTTPPWMKIILRDETDPFSLYRTAGAINVIDLANIHSCCFIATDDRGKMHADGRFEVLGRMDNADVRGCSQMI